MTSTRVFACLGIYHQPAQGQPILPLQARHGLLHSEQLCWSVSLQVSVFDFLVFSLKMVNERVKPVVAAGYV